MKESGFDIGFLEEHLKSIDVYLKTFTILWLLDQSSRNNESQLAAINNKIRLCIGSQQTQPNVYQCKEMRTCIKRLRKLTDRNVILLISRNQVLSDEEKSRLCSFPHVECIYEFGSEKPCIKLSTVFNNESCLSNISPDVRNSLLANLNRETKIFALKQVLLELLQQISCTEKEKEDFIKFCLTKDPNEKDIEDINQYRNAYFEKKAIWWYTGDNIISRIINRTIREENLNCIIKIRYFIHELYSEVNELYLVQLPKLKSGIQLYRGKVLSRDELYHLQRSVGGFVVTNSFVSTSEDQDVARFFAADGKTQSEDEVSVMFSFKFNVKDNISKPVASIDKYSQKKNHEKEVLLSSGIIMRIVSVNRVEGSNMWIVELVRDVNEEKFENEMYENFRKQIGSILGVASFLKTMDDGRYFLEYCYLMSNLLDQQNPEIARELRTLASNYRNLSESVPGHNDSPFTAAPPSPTFDENGSSHSCSQIKAYFNGHPYIFVAIIILTIVIITSIILGIILPTVVLKKNEEATSSVTAYTNPFRRANIAATTETTTITIITTNPENENTSTSCISMNDLFLISCCTVISIFFNINGNFLY